MDVEERQGKGEGRSTSSDNREWVGEKGYSAEGNIEFSWDSSVAALSNPVATSPPRT